MMSIKRSGFTLIELVVSIGLFMVAISISLVATVGTNSLISRTDARSTISDSARSVSDTLRRVTANAPVGAVVLHAYYGGPDTFAGVQVKAFSGEQGKTTCEVVGRATPVVTGDKQEIYTLDTAGTAVAYWVYPVDSAGQCPAIGTTPLYQNRLTATAVSTTDFQLQMNSYDCDPAANCTTKQQLRYSFSVELAAKQSGLAKESRSASTTVNSSLPIGLINVGVVPVNVLTTELPDGTVGVAYTKEILGEGGRLPYAWSYTGSLVAGLSMAQQGNNFLITGTPTVTGVSNITVTLRDSSNSPLTDQQQFIFSVGSGGGSTLQITTTTLPIGTVGTPYTATLQATGGTGQLNWSVLSGSLPAGLILNPLTGAINGTPSVQGLSQLTIHVRDAIGNVDTKLLSILIEAAGGGCSGRMCEVGGDL